MELPDNGEEDHHTTRYKLLLLLPQQGKDDKLLINRHDIHLVKSLKDHISRVDYFDRKEKKDTSMKCTLDIGCLEKQLCINKEFYRVHYQHIVCTHLIYSVCTKENSLTLQDGTRIPLGSKYSGALLKDIRISSDDE